MELEKKTEAVGMFHGFCTIASTIPDEMGLFL
jgi:hypothetical protein